jgi:hypothetical protein
MRVLKGVRLDPSLIEPARKRAGLPENAPEGAVVRYALAVLAGVDPKDHIDWTGGRGAASYRAKQGRSAA